MKRSDIWKASFLLFALFFNMNAFAARSGVIDADEVEIREQPNSTSKVIDKVKKGTPIAASNLPVEGYHRIRTESGTVGWVPMNTLSLQAAPTPEDLVKAGAPTIDDDGATGVVPKKSRSERIKATRKTFRIRLLGGMDFFSLTGIINNFGSLGIGYHYGGELVLMFSDAFGVVVRGENIFNSTILTDSTTSISYQVSVGSFPIMGGPEFAILGKAFSVHIGVLGGISLPTSIVSAVTSGAAAGGSATLSANSLSLLGRVNFNWQFTDLVSIFMEGGYRYLVSPSFTPINTPGTAAGIFQSSFVLNLSGPIVSAGLSFGF